MKKRAYKTLRGNIHLLDLLPKEHQELIEDFRKKLEENFSYQVFPLVAAIALYQKLELKPDLDALAKLPVFTILHDIEERALVKQGTSSLIGYQDELQYIIAGYCNSSQKEFAKKTGVNEGQLTRVLQGKTHFSIKRLNKALKQFNLRVGIVNLPDENPFIQDPVEFNDIAKSYEFLLNLIKRVADLINQKRTNIIEFVEHTLKSECVDAKEAEFGYLAGLIVKEITKFLDFLKEKCSQKG